MQHSVGAKLDHITDGAVKHHGVAVTDAPSARSGDFLLDDVAVHVTTALGKALIRKCVSKVRLFTRSRLRVASCTEKVLRS